MKSSAIMDDIYRDLDLRNIMFNERLESEFHKVITEHNLPLDRDVIASEGFLVERNYSDPGNSSATITKHGKSVSRTIKMDDAIVNTRCLDPQLKANLISGGMLCEVLEDLCRMTEDASKTLQELLNEPKKKDFNCTEIYVNPESNLINRVICLGKEYKT